MRLLVALVLVALARDAGAADPKAGEKKAQLCVLCHRTGSQFGAGIPLLEGQPAGYLIAATNEFKAGKRSSPAMQPNIERLSARDIADIAGYFAAKSPTPATPADPAKVSAGQARVAELGCASCHQPALRGADLVPRLAGQASGYLASQLDAYASGQRRHPAAAMPPSGDIENVAAYLSGLR